MIVTFFTVGRAHCPKSDGKMDSSNGVTVSGSAFFMSRLDIRQVWTSRSSINSWNGFVSVQPEVGYQAGHQGGQANATNECSQGTTFFPFRTTFVTSFRGYRGRS